MRARFSVLDREHRIKQQHPLISPSLQTATGRDRNRQIPFNLLVDIAQRRWNFFTLGNRKTQPVRLPRPVIGVLPENHNTHRLESNAI